MASTLEQDIKSVRGRIEMLRTTKADNGTVRGALADAEHCLTRALDEQERHADKEQSLKSRLKSNPS